MMTDTTQYLLQPYPDLPLTMRDAGQGPPVLMLHGGAGPLILLDATEPIISGHERSVPDPTGDVSAPPGSTEDEIARLVAYAGPNMQNPELFNLLSGARMPVLRLWGEQDPIVPPSYGRAFTETFIHSNLQVIPGTRHLPTNDVPDPIFTAVDSFPHP